ncbi:hypothetical protein F4781DRAFT_438871 [Annulohypoxylon bovei var. microspora]|nr:hypothetical protein F4781DRAFT_438871 [Annulohypoxylon bovei var. microspora]
MKFTATIFITAAVYGFAAGRLSGRYVRDECVSEGGTWISCEYPDYFLKCDDGHPSLYTCDGGSYTVSPLSGGSYGRNEGWRDRLAEDGEGILRREEISKSVKITISLR